MSATTAVSIYALAVEPPHPGAQPPATEDDSEYALLESLWRFNTGKSVVSSPTVAEDAVYVGSSDGNLYALDAASGVTLWRYWTWESVFSSPATAEGIVYVGSDTGSLHALDAVSGDELWRYETAARVYSSPAVAEGAVYFGSDDDHLYALDAADGSLLWRYRTGDNVGSSPAVVEGVVYCRLRRRPSVRARRCERRGTLALRDELRRPVLSGCGRWRRLCRFE